ncbi:MAG: hypothetical protein NVS3B17_11240 [Vulcanimicrobiaceae bacterium]
MDVAVDAEREFPVVRVSGELDIATLDRFERIVGDTIALSRGAVVVSLLETTYCDSLTVSAILSLQSQCDADDQVLLLVMSERGTPRRVFDIVGVTKRMAVYRTVAEAIAAASEQVRFRRRGA